jgi:hypothetical protein
MNNATKRQYEPFLKNTLSIKKQLHFRYIISVEGNDVATNLKWALASNSVVFMPPPTRESFILEGSLRPWEHYMPLGYNMADLEDKVRYCEAHLRHCEAIAQRASAWIKQLDMSDGAFHQLGARSLSMHLKRLRGAGIYRRNYMRNTSAASKKRARMR